MASPYLIEIRTGGEVKRTLRGIINDVSDEFNVYGAASPRPVPHVTLFGPYNTNKGSVAKSRVKSICSDFKAPPYRIDGFDTFPENNVVYARVTPSEELRRLRRELSKQLRPIAYNYRPWDTDYWYDFHITIAFKDVGDSKFDDIYQYVEEEYDLEFDCYATRVTSLRRRSMMWEYDLPSSRELRPNEATSASSWEETDRILSELRSPDDHDDLQPKPGRVSRVMGSAKRLIPGVGW